MTNEEILKFCYSCDKLYIDKRKITYCLAEKKMLGWILDRDNKISCPEGKWK